MQHPNVFDDLLGAREDFNSKDLSRAKARSNRKASLLVRYGRLSAPKKNDSSDIKDTFWSTEASRFEARFTGTGYRRVQYGRIELTGRNRRVRAKSGSPPRQPGRLPVGFELAILLQLDRCPTRHDGSLSSDKKFKTGPAARSGEFINGPGRGGSTILFLNCGLRYQLIAAFPGLSQKRRTFFADLFTQQEPRSTARFNPKKMTAHALEKTTMTSLYSP